MTHVQHLVIGAGISGLAYANAVLDLDPASSVLVVERDDEPGGLCKTVRQDGFVWDYSGHYFHFRHPEIAEWLFDRMPPDVEVHEIERRSEVYHRGTRVDFPFQSNIHQLPRDEFMSCYRDWQERGVLRASDLGVEPGSLKELAYQRFGRGIAERFFIPYNEKLYATDLNALDQHALGRFLPQVDLERVLGGPSAPEVKTYNHTFSYSSGGAISYIQALLRDLPERALSLGEDVISIDPEKRIAVTTKRTLRFDFLVSSAPLPSLLSTCGEAVDREIWNWNKVLVFNLGFDGKGPEAVHWIYYPDRDIRFYRVGFYDNLIEGDRMSLYVEVGTRRDAELDTDAELEIVMRDLSRVGVVEDQSLVSRHSVVLDPAYVHISRRSDEAKSSALNRLAEKSIFSIGRYGAWTYCSIEDNIVEARRLARGLPGLDPRR